MAFCLWQMAHLGGFRWDYDEGAHMMQAHLMLEGYPLYAETFSGQPPLLISSLAGAFALLGPSVQVGRALMVAYATLGLLALALIARELHGWTAAVGTVVLLGIAPDFFLYSRVSMGDVPSTSLAALAVLCALRYRSTGRRGWVMAYWMGYRISGALSWARIVPSRNSTIEWITLWGWTRTSTRSTSNATCETNTACRRGC